MSFQLVRTAVDEGHRAETARRNSPSVGQTWARAEGGLKVMRALIDNVLLMAFTVGAVCTLVCLVRLRCSIMRTITKTDECK